jgi:hypothetical protein
MKLLTREVHELQNNSSLSKKEILSEDINDFSDFTDYRRLCLPIRCGSRVGIVCTYSNRNNLNENYDRFYRAGLKNLIELKKYTESEKYGFDVGPTYAIAALIEDGEYNLFLNQFNSESLKLTPFEHVIQIRENGNTYHILPVEDYVAFGNIEQIGLIRFSVFQAFSINPLDINKEEMYRKISDWISSNNFENAKKFREILNKCRIKKIEGIEREFSKSLIYENLFNRIKTEFQLNELLSKLENEKI